MIALSITTFMQSKALVIAGLNAETADYVYQIEAVFPTYGTAYKARPRRDGDAFTTDVIPAWSLGRLWDLFTERGWHYDFSTATPAVEVINLLVDALIVKMRNQ